MLFPRSRSGSSAENNGEMAPFGHSSRAVARQKARPLVPAAETEDAGFAEHHHVARVVRASGRSG